MHARGKCIEFNTSDTAGYSELQVQWNEKAHHLGLAGSDNNFI